MHAIGGALSILPPLPLLHPPHLPADNTLVDAAPCSIAPNDWPLLDWRYVLVTNSYGRQLQAQYAPLPGHDPFSGAAAAVATALHQHCGLVGTATSQPLGRGAARTAGAAVHAAVALEPWSKC